MKKCYKCNEEKDKSCFSKHSKSKDGLQSKCKQCTNEYMKNRLLLNKDKINEKRKKQYEDQIDKKRKQSRDSYKKFREKRIESSKKYAIENKEKVAQYKIKHKAKKRLDPIYVLSQQVSCLVRISLINKGFPKRGKTLEIIGCDWDSFALHIERQFLPNMSWENRSEWHIDHIIPLASANTEEDVILLNHFTNLRPLWAKDNLSKGSKMEHLL